MLLLRRTYKIFLNYTDYHEVDEDVTAIVQYGGAWYEDNNNSGVMYRDVFRVSDTLNHIGVASSDIRN